MPPALLKALGEAFAKDQLPPLNIYYMHGTEALAESLLKNELEGKFTPRCLFLSSHDRQAIAGLQSPHWVEFVPCAFHQVGRLLTQQTEPDCFMVTVSPMDKHGYFSLGTNADYGAEWACERGVFEIDGRCDPVALPANAFLDQESYGPGWRCERRFEAVDNACVAIDLPANAHLDRSGNRWRCDRSFQLSDGACVLGR